MKCIRFYSLIIVKELQKKKQTNKQTKATKTHKFYRFFKRKFLRKTCLDIPKLYTTLPYFFAL